MWPTLAILALIALAIVHFSWRRRFRHGQDSARLEIETLRQQQREDLQQIEKQEETLFDSMVEGLLLLDDDGRIQLANRAFTALFDITANIRGKTLLEVLRQHELTGLLKTVDAETQVLGYELKVPGLSERWLQINAAAIFNGDNQKQGTVLVFHDLTRLKQLERTREEFVANVSHELRTPLSLIKGYVETLLDGAKDNPEVETKFLQTIQRNAERLQLLIEDLLVISELESGRLRMNLQPVRLRPLVEKILDDFDSQAKARRVQLINEMADLTAQADADRLQQVFGNLIGNAVKYGRNDGHVRLGGRVLDSGTIEISVRDDGPGISAESLERIFERFYRADKARSREQGGTGLGLSIVKHIIQSHGGKVWAKSELGRGTEFFFTLSAAPDSRDS